MRVFLDASMLVAAALSRKGGSFRLINEARIRGFSLFTSDYAYREAEIALEDKYGDNLADFYELIHLVFVIKGPDRRNLKKFQGIISDKDAAILADTLDLGADVLITLDRRHFLHNLLLKEKYPSLEIVTSGDFIQKYFV